MQINKKNLITATILLFLTLIICLFSGLQFLSMNSQEAIYPNPSLTSRKMLSSYFPPLKNTPGDTAVFIYQGKGEGGNLLILGGTHPNEPAGFITAVLLIENIKVSKGKVVIIPQANNSGFTHNDPQEGNPQRFYLLIPQGKREFRYGSRLLNPIHQWPDPTLYINPAGQKLAGSESRNLNRCYPGKKRGYLTEKIAYAIMELIKKEQIDLGLDLHEAAPEYPVINAIVFHQNSAEIAALAQMELQLKGFEFRLEASPTNLRGLSHREWGDKAHIKAILLESANAAQGRLRGKTSANLIVTGQDKEYAKAAKLGRLFVPYGPQGIPLKQRVARHVAAIEAIISSFNQNMPEKPIIISKIPPFSQIQTKGIGAFLALQY